MKIAYEKSFDKDLDKIINDKKLLERLHQKILGIKKASSIKEISNMTKLVTTKNYYRIKLGDYRIGAKIIEDEITLIRFLPRKDIYKDFPTK